MKLKGKWLLSAMVIKIDSLKRGYCTEWPCSPQVV